MRTDQEEITQLQNTSNYTDLHSHVTGASTPKRPKGRTTHIATPRQYHSSTTGRAKTRAPNNTPTKFACSRSFPRPIDISDISDISDVEKNPPCVPLYRDDSDSDVEKNFPGAPDDSDSDVDTGSPATVAPFQDKDSPSLPLYRNNSGSGVYPRSPAKAAPSQDNNPPSLPLYREDSDSEIDAGSVGHVKPPRDNANDMLPPSQHPLYTVIGDLSMDGRTGLVVDLSAKSRGHGLSGAPQRCDTRLASAASQISHPAWAVYRGGSQGHSGVCHTEQQLAQALRGQRNNSAYKKFPSLALAQLSYQDCLETGIIALVNQTNWEPKEKFMILKGIKPGICQGRQGLLHRLGYRGGAVVRITKATDELARAHFAEHAHLVEKVDLPPLA